MHYFWHSSKRATIVANLKFKLSVATLAVYGAVGAIALASELSPEIGKSQLFAACLESPGASASSGESGSSNWQSFLPGMLK